jgi:effector-binding domain-containing protein
MKIFKGLLIVIVVIFALFLFVTVFLPSHYSIERKIEISAPSTIVFYLIDDFRNWRYWDTWWNLDTNQKRIYSGPLFGVNSAFTWQSKDKNVGSGTVKIVEDKPFEYIRFTMTFGRELTSNCSFRLMPLDESKVLVSWRMDGDLKFLAKWFRFFLDKVIGKDFEIGLQNIKKLSENIVRDGVVFFKDTFPEMKIIYIPDSTKNGQNEIAKIYSITYEELMEFSNKHNLKYTGNPISIIRTYSDNVYSFDACLPVDSLVQPEGRIKIGTIPQSFVLRTVYLGSYRSLSSVYEKIHKYLQKNMLTPKGNFFEMYFTDPQMVSDRENITIIYCPL